MPEKSLLLANLQPYQPRSFVPEDADLRDKDAVSALFTVLRDRPITSRAQLEQWLLDRSELEAALDQQGTILYIRMTCQTDHQENARAHTDFIEQVLPAVRTLEDALNQRFRAEQERFPLDPDRYGVYARAVTADLELFCPENVPLATQVELLSQDYQTLCGAMTVDFQGEERTLPQMAKYLLQTDRGVREAAWRATAARRLADRDRLDQLFDQMLGLRNQIAANAGCRDFCEYQFRAYHRFDYTPDQCRQYHRTVAEVLVPIAQRIAARRRQQMNVECLRPWDTQVDPLARPPLSPFNEVPELIAGVGRMMSALDPELGRQFQLMADQGLLDLASRKGKAPGGYQSTLAEARLPFIFMNAVGVDQDVRTLMHESGHAFHALAAAQEPLHDYRHAPMEFCEVASMSMELLAGPQLGVFYNEPDRRRSEQDHLEDVVQILIWVAVVDAFQFWIYEHPGHTVKQRREAWRAIQDQFGAGGGRLDRTGGRTVQSLAPAAAYL